MVAVVTIFLTFVVSRFAKQKSFLYIGLPTAILEIESGKQMDAWHSLDLDLQKIAFVVK
jgi:hypothetical protein